jgi:YD repeat-containing protein
MMYDDDARLTTTMDPTGWTTSIAYDNSGRETKAWYRSGLLAHGDEWTYDAAGQPVSLIEKSGLGSTHQRFTYTYDGVGSRTVILDKNGSRTTYTYDAKDRLTQDATTGLNTHTYDYGYDANDNRLTATENGLNTFTYNAFGQLTTSTDGTNLSTYTYDDNGNLTVVAKQGSNPVTMSYDKENRLAVHKDGGTVVSYTYGADGLKRTEVTGSGTTTLVWDGSDYLQGRA